jgi:hypothetical protein
VTVDANEGRLEHDLISTTGCVRYQVVSFAVGTVPPRLHEKAQQLLNAPSVGPDGSVTVVLAEGLRDTAPRQDLGPS